MTITEAAMTLGVSEKTVRRRVKDGSIPAQLVGDPPHYEIPSEAIASMAASMATPREDVPQDDLQPILWELTEAVREQLREKDRQLEEKDRQIHELHVLLQTGQEHLSRMMLAQPPMPQRSRWKFWSRQA